MSKRGSIQFSIRDLQLAAELGRTLLERNEELENELKQQQAIIEDQAQEIEFLTKQATSMKEQSEHRGKFYEQLEQTIIELERTNDHLSREHEVDKKRIQSLCENIEYLERKCEEMSRALETIRDEQTKRGFHGSRGKMNRGSYFNFGSDSSEEDNMNSGFGYGFGYGCRRRSHSLQDLRDYTPSPDEFDSGNSNSPDLKTSESEYVESLESRIEELLVAKKNEADKVNKLESQIRLLIQENANLQNQLVQMSNEKDEQIADLRRQLLDSDPSVAIISPASPSCSSSSTSSHSPRPSSSANLGDVEASSSSSSSTSSSSRGKTHLNHHGALDLLNINSNTMLMCKRCTAEVSILSLVNSIEVENDGEVNGCYADFPYGVTALAEDHDMEFSSLEHELARATGASLPLDNRHNKKSPPRNVNRSFPLFPRHRTSIFQRDKSANNKPHGNDIQLECDDDLEYDENFELFLGHQPTYPRGAEGSSPGKHGRRLFIMEESSDTCGSSTHDEDIDLDEEPCLTKDRKPEISRSKKNSGRLSSKNCSPKSKKVAGTSRNGGSSCGLYEEGSNVPVTNGELADDDDDDDNEGGAEGDEPAEELSITFTSRIHSKLLELPTRIPSDEEDDEDDYEYDDDVIDGILAAKHCVPASSDAAILQDHLRDGELLCENNNDQDKCQNREPVKKTKLWWLAWFILVVMGVFQLIWAILSLLFFLVTAAVLPGGSKGSSSFAAVSSSCGIQESSSSSGYDSSEEENEHGGRAGKAWLISTEVEKLPLVKEEEGEPEDKESVGPEVATTCPTDTDQKPEYDSHEDDTPEGGNLAITGSSISTPSTSCNNNSSVMPEYKQILQNLFSLFNNSKRKYPIPMYPYVKGQSSALIMSQSINSTSTNSNNNTGCSSH
ncbi:Cerebellar degeneration-related protein 2 [Orchesella cincta]|uniref:Cerebellar degeneration-related protein 2 n=1 Tax=Orchesella cincta TaxID=48709 RepID=A0A1D2N3Y9_ORCCI|nr:Cerebellar degeneration-related protein 2 [Orchesella cincta]